MTDKVLAQADPEWLALISSAREWLSGPHGQLLLEDEQRVLEDELGGFSAVIWCITARVPTPRPRPLKYSVMCVWGRRCPASKSSVKSRPGLYVSMLPMSWCCSMAWIFACHPMACCVKRPVVCDLAGIC